MCRILSGCPNHHSTCRPPIPLSNESRKRLFSWKPTNTYIAIRMLHAETGLVWKDDIVQLLHSTFCSEHQNQHLALCCIVNGSCSNCCRADSSCCCKRRSTVRSDTGSATSIPISWFMVRVLVVLFWKADLTICLAFLVVREAVCAPLADLVLYLLIDFVFLKIFIEFQRAGEHYGWGQ